MSPIQQMLLGVGAVATKTYIDDIFSTYVFKGDGSYPRTITNNINLSEKDGLVIHKSRSDSYGWVAYDTIRGAGAKALRIDTDAGENAADVAPYALIDQFNNNGFRINQPSSTDVINGNNLETASWTFRKEKGFFDIVQYSGNSVNNRQISHNLGSNVGMVIIKCLDSSDGWAVWHRDLPNTTDWLALEENWEADKYPDTNGSLFGTSPARTSTYFTVGFSGRTNQNGQNYIAYVFAGGESDAATARSVDFDGNDHLTFTNNSDLNVGTSDFCYEFWVFPNDYSAGNNQNLFSNGSSGIECSVKTDASGLVIRQGSDGVSSSGQLTTNSLPPEGQWTHVAITKSSGTMRIFFNGLQVASASNSTNYNGDGLFIGVYNNYWRGKISNFRLVKGTAVYTSSFRPPTEPLTNITNTKLLCCNNSSVTGSTVIPSGVSITANGDPTASSNSPFDDPAGFVFGDAGDQNVIKCGSFVASTDYDVWNNRVIELGWEPSFVMYKNASSTGNWEIFDTMRGFLATSDDSAMLEANTSDAEEAVQRITIEPTGFKERGVITTGDTVIYVAIRRPDGYCGKPPELGTDVFAMDTGNGSSTVPTFDSGFPVDFGLTKNPDSSGDWYTVARLLGGNHLVNSGTNAISNSNWTKWDSNVGEGISWSSSYLSWMFKRHAGFDVVAYTGSGDGDGGNPVPHSLSKTPEMAWIKRTDGSGNNWFVYHLGANGGTNPENYFLYLNTTASEVDNGSAWMTPTATHITFGSDSTSYNREDYKYLMMLFASVGGISKVGYYDGTSSEQTISTAVGTHAGFQPRFVIIKSTTDSTEGWYVFDTVRGWASGNDKNLLLDSNAAQGLIDMGQPTSTGFTITSTAGAFNTSGEKYIYYAHA